MSADAFSKIELSEKEADFISVSEQRFGAKKIEILFDQLVVAIKATVLAALILVGLLWVVVPLSILLMWFGFFILQTIFRLIVLHKYRHRTETQSTDYWLSRFVMGVFISGATWGSSILILIPQHSTPYLGLVVLWVCGLTAGSIASLSIIRGAFFAFALPALLPAALILIMMGGKEQLILGVALLMYLGFISLNSNRMHKTLMQSLRLEFRNEQLIFHLDAQCTRVEKLNDQLERRVTERTSELSQINLRLQHEIDEHKQTGEKLRLNAAVFENTSEGVIIMNAEKNIIAINRAFTEITEYRVAEVLGRNPQSLYSYDHPMQDYGKIWSSVTHKGCWQGEIWNRRKNGEIYPQWTNISPINDEQGRLSHYVCVFTDITVLKDSQKRFEYLAHHDPLTDLPNRLLLSMRLDHALERSRREGGKVAVLFFDIDRFKNINDSLGHPAGDLLLQQISKRLLGLVREEDTVARQSGDEFIILLEGLAEGRDAATVVVKALGVLALPFDLEGHEVYVTGSVGISLFPDDASSAETLLKNADIALYRAKDKGRNNFQFFTRKLTVAAARRSRLESSLQHAMESKEFELFYQPQLSLRTGKVVGAEALVRWRNPQLGLMSPAGFLALTEETGLILELGQWVLRKACTQAMVWQNEGWPALRIAVNISPVEIVRGELIETVEQVLLETGLQANQLELEITERLLWDQTEQSLETLTKLNALGVSLAMDDFGRGCSSLSYLRNSQFQTLKIDQLFVQNIPVSLDDTAIIRTVIALAKRLRMNVIAEGVETRAQQEILQDCGCDQIQGYLFSAPLERQEFEKFFTGRFV
jgi:diguanylate cyclase (GGDEF)-like protein/PAS domain S-box-containing protein